MHKLDKFLRRHADSFKLSQTTLSRYYTFGILTLRVSDHVSIKNEKNYPISIVLTGKDQYVLQNHKCNKLSVLSYEEVKTMIKSLSIYQDIFSTGDKDYQAKLERQNIALKAEIKNLLTERQTLTKNLKTCTDRIATIANECKVIKFSIDPAVVKVNLTDQSEDNLLANYTKNLYSALTKGQRENVLSRANIKASSLSSTLAFKKLGNNPVFVSYCKAILGHTPNEILSI